jgi:diamine N-acetyltransferase
MFTIRPATMNDFEGLCPVIAELDQHHVDALPIFFLPSPEPPRERQWLEDILSNPESQILLVAESDGEIVGFVFGLLREAPDTPFHVKRRYLLVDNLSVSQKMRGTGVGRALMEQAHEWARSQGVTQIELGVYEFNEGARQFYEALGYKTITRRMWKGE